MRYYIRKMMEEKANRLAISDLVKKGGDHANWILYPMSLPYLTMYPCWLITLIVISMCVVRSHTTQKSLKKVTSKWAGQMIVTA